MILNWILEPKKHIAFAKGGPRFHIVHALRLLSTLKWRFGGQTGGPPHFVGAKSLFSLHRKVCKNSKSSANTFLEKSTWKERKKEEGIMPSWVATTSATHALRSDQNWRSLWFSDLHYFSVIGIICNARHVLFFNFQIIFVQMLTVFVTSFNKIQITIKI